MQTPSLPKCVAEIAQFVTPRGPSGLEVQLMKGPGGRRRGEVALDSVVRVHTSPHPPPPAGPQTGWKILEEASSEPLVRPRINRWE